MLHLDPMTPLVEYVSVIKSPSQDLNRVEVNAQTLL